MASAALRTRAFRRLLESGRLIQCLGVTNAVEVMAAEAAGACALYVSGYAVAACMAGAPDDGRVSRDEMVAQIRRICGVTRLPVLADADTGFGDDSEVAATVALWEQAGAAGLHIEDQVFPKRCAQTGAVDIVAVDQMTGRLRIAVAARKTRDFVIIGRTDALLNETVERVTARCRAYGATGIDALFVNAVDRKEKLAALWDSLRDTGLPLVFNAAPSERGVVLSRSEYGDYGVRIVIHPVEALLAAHQAALTTYRHLLQAGNSDALNTCMTSLQQLSSSIKQSATSRIEQIADSKTRRDK